MSKTIKMAFCGASILAVMFRVSSGISTLSADDGQVAKRCHNQALAPFVPLAAGQRIAATSQAIDRIVFTDSDPNSGDRLEGWGHSAAANASLNYGNHSVRVQRKKKSTPTPKKEIMTLNLMSTIQLLPDFPFFLGVKPWGRLIAFDRGLEMTPVNNWVPAETKRGLFGATFSTQTVESPQGDREFVRVPTTTPNKLASFSLPIDLIADRNINDAFDVPLAKMPPCVVYEDFGNTEWLIYCQIDDEDGVVISQCEMRWDEINDNQKQTGEISRQRYKIGDMVQVSNLKFGIEEIVSFDQQVVPAAWVNISAIDIIR